MNLYNRIKSGIKAALKKKTPALFGVIKKIKKPSAFAVMDSFRAAGL